ncbi:helix-turn-helix domain-containing protein [Acidisoma cellulosilytica]|uniref:Helix-turn-helix domain-containing protein n=1 Tax=Acidisoma cellulosilyticum TaxID=2802395 RepID=A0A963Z696_9PROT|nr:helix-turn-helix domain-containing protein [Acidisoma cellulosilyticum]MCB8883627.1 helix-turn-helix domain-containing protein [Acidisoma cellulosilyticum]
MAQILLPLKRDSLRVDVISTGAQLLKSSMDSARRDFESWHHLTCRNYSLTECKKPTVGDFDGRVSMWDFGATSISEIETNVPSGHILVTRSSLDVQKDPRDDFMLYLGTRGELGMLQADRAIRIGVGDIALYDQSKPFKLDFIGESRGTVITIPRPLIISRLPSAQRATATRISGASRLGVFVGSLISQFVDLKDSVDRTSANRLALPLLDLLGASIEVYLDASFASDRKDIRLGQVKAYIRANLHDSTLTTETIAKAQGVAPRTLNRLFAIDGTTPGRWLWRQRLAASYKALADGSVKNVTSAAFDFGFSDLSHFTRSFKKEFGVTPRSLLG